MPKNLDFTLTEDMARIWFQDNDLDPDEEQEFIQEFSGLVCLGKEKGKSYRAINLAAFNDLTVGAAEILCKFDGGLPLGNIKHLSDDIAEQLSNFQGTFLTLESLVELSDAAADSLSKCKAEKIFLRGLTEITDAAAKSFSNYSGNLVLDFDQFGRTEGKLKMSIAAIEILSKKNSGEISFISPENWTDLFRDHILVEEFLQSNGHMDISDATANALSRQKGELVCDCLTTLSDAASEALSKHEGWLDLNGLTKLSDAAAESLSKHEGGLSLNGLTTLSDSAVESLSKYEGNMLSLDGITELSDAAAESLSKYPGSLSLNGLTKLSDTVAESLFSDAPFKMLVSNIDWDDYVGRVAIGKVLAGNVKKGDKIWRIGTDGQTSEVKITKVFQYELVGTKIQPGNIVGISGFEDVDIGETLSADEETEPIESLTKYEGELSLDGLTELSDAAAESLSKYHGSLSLNGLTKFSDTVAESLSKHDGILDLSGITELSRAAAKFLSTHSGAICDKNPRTWVRSIKKKK